MNTKLLFAAVLFISPLSVTGEDVFINLPKHMAVGAFQIAAGKIAVTIYEVKGNDKKT